jgi:transcriptional regulator with XRE-family HTH domain
MDRQDRRAGFAARFIAAVERSGNAGLSDEELSKLLARHRVSVSRVSVANWRNGRHLPKWDEMLGLAETLGVDPGELAFGSRSRRVKEPSASVYAPSTEERQLLDGFTLLAAPQRALVLELIRLLQPGARGKRPGPVKKGAAK